MDYTEEAIKNEQTKDWIQAIHFWNLASEISGEDYSFQIKACEIFDTIMKMDAQIPTNRRNIE